LHQQQDIAHNCQEKKSIYILLFHFIIIFLLVLFSFCFFYFLANRCASDAGQLKPVLTVKDNTEKNSDVEVGNIASSLFPGDVSVSIDDGETAVVVSFHKGSTDSYERGKEPESELLSKESQNISKDEKFPLVLSPICEPVSEESMLSGSNSTFETNEETKIEVSERSVVLESKPGIITMLQVWIIDRLILFGSSIRNLIL
jgi:hypothetical protein